MKKIGIFGGTFDPFTIAHEAIVKDVLDKKLVDEILIVPTIVDYHRPGKNSWLTYDQRVKVLNCFIQKFTICNYPVKLELCEYDFAKLNNLDEIKNRRFINTLIDLVKIYKDCEFYTIIGTDSYKNFETWFNYKDILKLSKLIVINGRDGEYINNENIPKIDLTISPEFAIISSTKVRKQYNYLNGYKDYLMSICRSEDVTQTVLNKTPIFDLVEKSHPALPFNPVGINSNDWVEIIVEKDGKFLMETQFRYGLMMNQIEFPCGIVEKFEDPFDAVQRELKEETGYDVRIEDLVYLGAYATNPAFMNNFMHYFYINLDNAEYTVAEQSLDEHEKIEILWLDKTEVINRFTDPTCINSAIMAGGLFLYTKKVEK